MTENQEHSKFTELSRRVTLSPETNQQLESIAQKYACMHGNKPSLNELLKQIGDERLTIARRTLQLIPQEQLIELEIEVIADMNGLFAEISGKIAEFKGNIYQSKADQYGSQRSIKVALSIPDTTNLPNLINSLRSIKFEDLKKFNTEQQQLQVLKTLEPEKASSYEQIAQNSSKEQAQIIMEGFRNNFLPEHEKCQMIANINFVIGFQITLDHQPGIVNKLSTLIAEKYISIRSININTDLKQEVCICEFFLGFNSKTVESFKSIETIKKVIKELKKMPFIQEVTQFSIAYSNGYSHIE